MTFYLKHMKSNKHTYIQFIIILKFINTIFKETVGILLVFHSSDVEKKKPRFEIDLLHILLKKTVSNTIFHCVYLT